MPANIMSADVGSKAYVMGSSIANVGTGPNPGNTPIRVPSVTPTKQYSRFAMEKAVEKPIERCSIKSMKTSPYGCIENVGQTGTIKFRPTTKISQTIIQSKEQSIKVSFHLNAWFAIEEIRTIVAVDNRSPAGLNKIAKATTAPRIMPLENQSKRPTRPPSSEVDLNKSALMLTIAPNTKSIPPNNIGKYPGPMRAAVPRV